MTTFLRVVGVLCVGVTLVGVLAPGMVSQWRPAAITAAATAPPTPVEAAPTPRQEEDAAASTGSPLIAALRSGVAQQGGRLGAHGEVLQRDLERADELMRETQRRNRAALRETSRRVRLPGGSPHILLVLVPGLTTERLHCYDDSAPPTPNFDRLAARGVRLRRFEPARHPEAAAWTCLADGADSVTSARAQSFLAVLWGGGYDTSLVGDATALAADPPAPGFARDQGLRAATRRPPNKPSATAPRRADAADEADADSWSTIRPGLQPLLEQAVRPLVDPTQGRPVFTLVSLPEGCCPLDDIDVLPARLHEVLERARLTASTLLMVAGIPADATSAAPFFVVWPGHFPEGTVADEPATWADVAATVCDLAEISPRPLKLRGQSQLRSWRGAAGAAQVGSP